MKIQLIIVLLLVMAMVLTACNSYPGLGKPEGIAVSESIEKAEVAEGQSINSEITGSTDEPYVLSTPFDSEKRVRQAQEVFLQEHLEEMTALAELMLASETNQITYQYTPKSHRLDWFNHVDYYTQGQITDHPILDAAAFLSGTEVFYGVGVVNAMQFDLPTDSLACVFYSPVQNYSGDLLAWANIVYSKSSINDNPVQFEELLPNWYYRIVYLPD